MAKVIAVNAGSSSLKFKLFDMPAEKVICSGLAEKIGHEDAIFSIKPAGKDKNETICAIKDHAVAVDMLLEALIEYDIVKSLDEIKGVGHRVVQGGEEFSHSEEITDKLERVIEELTPLAPLHNPANLVGYRAFKKALPKVKHVAVFDTAFHATMEPQDFMYPVPYEYYEKYKVRRYGFHGTSHLYLSQQGKVYLKDGQSRIITCHIGSGASLCAIKNGKCVATSMGLTPLPGVMMGTRTGDIDPSVITYMSKQTGKTCEDIYNELNKKSGVLGISGVSNDTRDVEKGALEGNERCKLAVQLFARRVADYIGQYYVRLGGCDLIVFSAGIGENSAYFRKEIIDQVSEALGVKLDTNSNNNTIRGKEGYISTFDSKIPVVVIPTDEEIVIARDTCSILKIK
ncbi:MAG: acetate kinase [Erysipelotrichaceae bacterium]|nr:acetate kinase [Erysipelotrichaceae bacterium]